eukprot:CAMPEP_0113859420 /NCGR_PEP_ID=MMETSP0372-20130328/12340_1 /TAXON_ID=340204 /ORGANISM="Lankesteria abbotti" /LENGTH=59 /DNA_ID=CAMNT_0000837647 /DNA_START=89 /DNA_END=264 /DNA_ORIENTATION=+ /assembly_acc=CAM_ASM_000359
MTLFLTCNDVFRTCSRPDEYFDYGLWIPPDEVMKGVDKSMSRSSSARTTSSVESVKSVA